MQKASYQIERRHRNKKEWKGVVKSQESVLQPKQSNKKQIFRALATEEETEQAGKTEENKQQIKKITWQVTKMYATKKASKQAK